MRSIPAPAGVRQVRVPLTRDRVPLPSTVSSRSTLEVGDSTAAGVMATPTDRSPRPRWRPRYLVAVDDRDVVRSEDVHDSPAGSLDAR